MIDYDDKPFTLATTPPGCGNGTGAKASHISPPFGASPPVPTPSITVEYTHQEAEALLDALREPLTASWAKHDPDLLIATSRLQKAVDIERGSCGVFEGESA